MMMDDDSGDILDYSFICAFIRRSAIKSLTFICLAAHQTEQASRTAGEIATNWHKILKTDEEPKTCLYLDEIDFRTFCTTFTDDHQCAFFLPGPTKRKMAFWRLPIGEGTLSPARSFPVLHHNDRNDESSYEWMKAPLHVVFRDERFDGHLLAELARVKAIKSLKTYCSDVSPMQAIALGRFLSASDCEHFAFDIEGIIEQAEPFLRHLFDVSDMRSLKLTWSGKTLGALKLRQLSILLSRFLYLGRVDIKYVPYNDAPDDHMFEMFPRAIFRALDHLPCLDTIIFSCGERATFKTFEEVILKFINTHPYLTTFEIYGLVIEEEVSNFAQCEELLRRIIAIEMNVWKVYVECNVGGSLQLTLEFVKPILLRGNKSSSIEGTLQIECKCRIERLNESSANSMIEWIDRIRRLLGLDTLYLSLKMSEKDDTLPYSIRLAAYKHISWIACDFELGWDQPLSNSQAVSLWRFGTEILKIANPRLRQLILMRYTGRAERCAEMKGLIDEALKNNTTPTIESSISPLDTFLPIRNKIIETQNAVVSLLPSLIRRFSVKPRETRLSRFVPLRPSSFYAGDMCETGIFLALKTHSDKLTFGKQSKKRRR